MHSVLDRVIVDMSEFEQKFYFENNSYTSDAPLRGANCPQRQFAHVAAGKPELRVEVAQKWDPEKAHHCGNDNGRKREPTSNH